MPPPGRREDEPTKEAAMSTPTIEVRGLGKTYPGGIEAVKGIDFDVAPGEVFGLLGPNGAGKSTTIGMLTTTVRPTRGRARLAGHDVATDPLAARAQSSVVFQKQVLDRSLSARRNLEIHARLWGVEPHIEEIASAFGLDELLERPVATLSGGQRRRLEIARALVSQPRVLFLVEPTVGPHPRRRVPATDRRPSGRGRLKGDPDVHPHTRPDPRAAAAAAQPACAARHPRAATLPAHGPHAARARGAAHHADPVRARDRAGAE